MAFNLKDSVVKQHSSLGAFLTFSRQNYTFKNLNTQRTLAFLKTGNVSFSITEPYIKTRINRLKKCNVVKGAANLYIKESKGEHPLNLVN